MERKIRQHWASYVARVLFKIFRSAEVLVVPPDGAPYLVLGIAKWFGLIGLFFLTLEMMGPDEAGIRFKTKQAHIADHEVPLNVNFQVHPAEKRGGTKSVVLRSVVSRPGVWDSKGFSNRT